MYGMIWIDVGPDPEPVPTTEPTPMDKALDEKIKEQEFTLRRKYKRQLANDMDKMDKIAREYGYGNVTESERAVDRAMHKMDGDLEARLKPYRGPNV